MTREWLRQRKSDPYYRQAKSEGFRSRATFKLKEMNERLHLFKQGGKVLDVGAAPGGWSQYAVGIVGPQGKVVAVDIVPMPSVQGVEFLLGDIEEPSTIEGVLAISSEYDAVVSDASPNLSGNKNLDRGRCLALSWAVMTFALRTLRKGGSAVVKMFRGDELTELKGGFSEHFSSVSELKPRSSLGRSSEVYLAFRGYKGRSEG